MTKRPKEPPAKPERPAAPSKPIPPRIDRPDLLVHLERLKGPRNTSPKRSS